jgi:cysteinyl-tRNA synthetase
MCLKKKRNLLNDKRIYTGRSKRKVNASFLRNLEKYQNYDIKNYFSLEQFAKEEAMSLATLRKLLKEYKENSKKFLEERIEESFEERSAPFAQNLNLKEKIKDVKKMLEKMTLSIEDTKSIKNSIEQKIQEIEQELILFVS